MSEGKESATSTSAGFPINRNSEAFRREQERDLMAVQDRKREKEAQNRRRVAEESTQKTAELAREGVVVRDFVSEATPKTDELAREGVVVRDFASEAVRRETAERNRRADEGAAVLQSSRETDEEKSIRERRERLLEEDLIQIPGGA